MLLSAIGKIFTNKNKQSCKTVGTDFINPLRNEVGFLYWHSFGLRYNSPRHQFHKKLIMANKKKPAKKAAALKKAIKKVAPKKVAPKKAAPKKAAPKKAIAKKTVSKKAVVKKAAVKKAVAKKPVAKKATAKKVIAPKKAIAKPTPAKKKVAAKSTQVSAAPAMAELSEELVEKAANTSNSKPMIAPGDGLNAAPVTDPVQAFDKNVFNKATAKGDPHSKLHLSKAKNTIKPSGKKPLW